jgi:AcrR family transcriptional regulator
MQQLSARVTSKPHDGARDPRAARREQILEAALRIADRDGFEGLTMRKLAAELGVSAPIVYRHFVDKASILDAIVRQMTLSRAFERRSTTDWKSWLRETFTFTYRELTAHPGMLEILASSGPFTEHAMHVADEVLAALESAGFPPERAARVFRWLMGYTLGAVTMERGARAALKEHGTQVVETLRTCPRVFMAGAYLGGSLGEAGFLWCLDNMLEAVDRDLDDRLPG